MYIAGIDVGTTGCKCTVYDSAGNFQKEAYQEYQAEITKESHTINPNLVWESVKKVLSQIANEIKEIEAICVTTFGEASVLLDEQDTP
jgi:xylulokinase